MASASPPPSPSARAIPAEAIGEGIRRVRSRLGEFMLLAAIPAFTSGLLTAFVPALSRVDAGASGASPLDAEQMLATLARPSVVGSALLSFLVETVCAAFVFGLALAVVRGDRRRPAALHAASARHVVAFVGWMLVAKLLILAGVLAFVIGALVVAFCLQLLPLVVMDRRRPVLRTALRVMRTRANALFFIAAYQFLGTMLVSLMLGSLGGDVYRASGQASAVLVIVVFVREVLMGLLLSVFVCAKARIYVDVVRRADADAAAAGVRDGSGSRRDAPFGRMAGPKPPLPEVPSSTFGPWPGTDDSADPAPPVEPDPLDRPPSPN